MKHVVAFLLFSRVLASAPVEHVRIAANEAHATWRFCIARAN